MDRIVEKSLLFDFYGELLTQHQKEVYGEYIQNDLSPTEIAVLRGISRQGAYDLIKRCEKILTDYENRLHLVEHFQKVKKTVASIHTCAEEIAECDDKSIVREKIAQIAELLETTPEAIEKMLSAQWVKDDSFVPIKTIPRVEEIELMKIEPDEEVLKEKERHEKLL